MPVAKAKQGQPDVKKISAPTFFVHANPTNKTAKKANSPRSQNKRDAFEQDLAIWRDMRLSQSTSECQQQAIEREYEERLHRGPESYHSGSEFIEAPINNLTREDANKLNWCFRAIRTHHSKYLRKPRGQCVSLNYLSVLTVLTGFAIKKGRVFPSIDTIARLALVSRSTVFRALDWLVIFGFVTRLRRLARRPSILGPRTVQVSNAYTLKFPFGVVIPALARGVPS